MPTAALDPDATERARHFSPPRAKEPGHVVVALSGGVDSAVAAWLLKEAGHEVTGVSLRLAPDPPGGPAKEGRCCSVSDMSDARQLCDALAIPFYAVDARDRFKEAVFDPFVRAYRGGLTPIPCLACNHEVKFGDLWRTAKALGARLGTGHYARVVSFEGRPALARPFDASRDQTYYLYGTPPDVVSGLELPLGDLDKPLVRALAARAGIPVFDKPDSQEICFVPEGDHGAVVERAGGPLPGGTVVDVEGRVLREHDGVHRFTVGQRRGVGVGGNGDRLFVLDVDAAAGQVTVGPRSLLGCTRVVASELRESVEVARWPEQVLVQVRARHHPVAATWARVQAGIELRFQEPVDAVALGQAAVLYAGAVLLGGGVLSARLDGAFPRDERRATALPIVA
jgi:tRNA-uridine 2-sulfurtransferase